MRPAGTHFISIRLKIKLTMKATTFETQPTEYDAVTLIYGSESVNMTKVTMEHSHVWYADITIAAFLPNLLSGDKTWGGRGIPAWFIC